MKSAMRMKKSGFHFTLGISRGLHLNEVKISSKLAWISSAVAEFLEFWYDKLMFMGVDKPCRGDHWSSVTTAVDFMVRAVEDVRPYKRKCCVFP